MVIQIVIGALGNVTKGVKTGLEDLEIRRRVDIIQRPDLIIINKNKKKKENLQNCRLCCPC